MDFIIKLFKAFNSSQTPWQMSLAISLGMVMGLTPFSGLQSVFIILIVLVINVHIGLFLVSSAFFAGVAYMLDPSFESIGYNILTNPSLQDLFTSAYNFSILRLTHFNNTLVLGSFVFAVALLIPMYFMLNSLVYVYRDKIAASLQKYKIFKTLGISISGKKDKFLRLWGFGVFVILAALVLVFAYLLLDPLMKKGLEYSLSKVVKKDVLIKNVDVDLKNGQLIIDDLNIFKNGVSSFKSELIKADVDFNQLLFKRYHIDNITVKGMELNQITNARIDTKNDSSKTDKEEKTNKEESSGFEFDTPSLPKPVTLIERAGLSSNKNYEKASNDIDEFKQKYKKIVEKNFSKEELNSIKSDINKIKTDLKKIKSLKNLKSKDYKLISKSMEDIKDLRKKIKQKRSKLKEVKKDFYKDKKRLHNLSNKLIKGAKSDYENLSKNYQFNKQGATNIVGVLFGNSVKDYLSTFLKYYEMAKPYLKSDSESPKPARGEGRWIKFKDLNSQVDLLVKNVDLSGTFDSHVFRSNIKNISSNQNLLNKPATLKLTSNGKLSKDVDLGLVKLNSADYELVLDAKTNDYKTLVSNTKIKYKDTKFSNSKLKDLEEFYVDIKMSKKILSPKVDVRSDLDKKLKSIFEKVIKEKLTKYKKQLKKLIDEQTKEKLKKLGLKNKEIDNISKKLNGTLDEFSDTDKALKNYEKDLDSKAKKRIENKAKDLLKSFKF